MSTPLENYLASCNGKPNAAMCAYVANLQQVAAVGPEIAASIVNEIENQRSHLKLVASENYCSLNVQSAMGNLLTDKYAEGYPEHRYYGGCVNIDAVENCAAREAEKLFGADYAYVQPHSGADTNLVAYWAILSAKVETPTLEELGVKSLNDLTAEQFDMLRKKFGNQKLMGLDYSCGGHLTHGYKMNVSARMFESHPYGVDEKTGLLDYDAIEKQAMEVKPLILLTGFSAYPRKIDFKRFRQIADKCGAVLMVDMAHFAGLVAGKVFQGDYDPVKWADIVTTTTHKTLRGPRGGMILMREDFPNPWGYTTPKGEVKMMSAMLNSAVFPGVQGGPLEHVIAAKAVAFGEALSDEYFEYILQVKKNAATMAKAFTDRGYNIISGGTDNHLMLIDLRTKFPEVTGKMVENTLVEADITVNKNMVPFDSRSPFLTSGLRIGTPAITTRGLKEDMMEPIVDMIDDVISAIDPVAKTAPEAKIKAVREKVNAMMAEYPLFAW